MRTSDFDYVLPADRIAAFPAPDRDGARLMRLGRFDGGAIHSEFRHIVQHIPPGALIVLNDTRVIPARVRGKKPTGGSTELLLIRRVQGPTPAGAERWEAIGRNLGRIAVGTRLAFDGGLTVEVHGHGDAGAITVSLRPPTGETVRDLLERIGEVPLPPYIETARKRRLESRHDGVDAAIVTRRFDRDRYQTVYAAEPGAVAAPTAGLHFTEDLLARLRAAGHQIVHLTLHVGLGTFRSVKAEDIEQHQMDSEPYTISSETAKAVNDARRAGRAVLAVGTTVVRALESSARVGARAPADVASDAGGDAGGDPGADASGNAGGDAGGNATMGPVRAGTAASRLFLRPGAPFHVVTDLVTNFHLPRSTLLMLVSAFAGRERILAAYAEAIAAGYRFYSYGDAMLIRGTP